MVRGTIILKSRSNQTDRVNLSISVCISSALKSSGNDVIVDFSNCSPQQFTNANRVTFLIEH